MMDIHNKLVHAATDFDRKQSSKPYNIYALGRYLKAIEDAEVDIAEQHITIRKALFGHFNGRLLDVMLKAVGETKSTSEEVRESDRNYFRSGICKDCGNGTLNNETNEQFVESDNSVACVRCGSSHVDGDLYNEEKV